MIITADGIAALRALAKLDEEYARWELECIERGHPEYGEIMDGIGRCLCGNRYYPEGPAFQHRVNRIVGELKEMWPR